MKGWSDQLLLRDVVQASEAQSEKPAAAQAPVTPGTPLDIQEAAAASQAADTASQPEAGRNGSDTTACATLPHDLDLASARNSPADMDGARLASSELRAARLHQHWQTSNGAVNSSLPGEEEAGQVPVSPPRRKRSAAAVREVVVHENFHIFDLGVALSALEAADIETSRPAPRPKARQKVTGLKCSLQRGARCATTHLVPCETWFDAPGSTSGSKGNASGTGSGSRSKAGGGRGGNDAEVVCADCWTHLKKVCPHDPVCRACYLVAQIGERGLLRAVRNVPDPAVSAPEQLLIRGLQRIVEQDPDDAAGRVKKLLAAYHKHMRMALAGNQGLPGRAPTAQSLLPESLQKASTALDLQPGPSAAANGARGADGEAAAALLRSGINPATAGKAGDAMSLAAAAVATAEAAAAAGLPDTAAARAAMLADAQRAIAALHSLIETASDEPTGELDARGARSLVQGGRDSPCLATASQLSGRPRLADKASTRVRSYPASTGPGGTAWLTMAPPPTNRRAEEAGSAARPSESGGAGPRAAPAPASSTLRTPASPSARAAPKGLPALVHKLGQRPSNTPPLPPLLQPPDRSSQLHAACRSRQPPSRSMASRQLSASAGDSASPSTEASAQVASLLPGDDQQADLGRPMPRRPLHSNGSWLQPAGRLPHQAPAESSLLRSSDLSQQQHQQQPLQAPQRSGFQLASSGPATVDKSATVGSVLPANGNDAGAAEAAAWVSHQLRHSQLAANTPNPHKREREQPPEPSRSNSHKRRKAHAGDSANSEQPRKGTHRRQSDESQPLSSDSEHKLRRYMQSEASWRDGFEFRANQHRGCSLTLPVRTLEAWLKPDDRVDRRAVTVQLPDGREIGCVLAGVRPAAGLPRKQGQLFSLRPQWRGGGLVLHLRIHHDGSDLASAPPAFVSGSGGSGSGSGRVSAPQTPAASGVTAALRHFCPGVRGAATPDPISDTTRIVPHQKGAEHLAVWAAAACCRSI